MKELCSNNAQPGPEKRVIVRDSPVKRILVRKRPTLYRRKMRAQCTSLRFYTRDVTAHLNLLLPLVKSRLCITTLWLRHLSAMLHSLQLFPKHILLQWDVSSFYFVVFGTCSHDVSFTLSYTHSRFCFCITVESL